MTTNHKHNPILADCANGLVKNVALIPISS
jgi:hypothetical protein